MLDHRDVDSRIVGGLDLVRGRKVRQGGTGRGLAVENLGHTADRSVILIVLELMLVGVSEPELVAGVEEVVQEVAASRLDLIAARIQPDYSA